MVDELGGLDKAVKKAAQLAKIDNYYKVSYPSPVNWFDQIFGENVVLTIDMVRDYLAV